jgi:large subunit ribosomal protein L25
MKRYKLTAEPRKITGKKVKKLRREGILPANVYGKGIKSQSLQLPLKDFLTVFNEAGETGVVDLTYGKDTVPVLIHNLHTDYRNTPLHADFFQVNLKEKVTAMIQIELIGESKAELEKIGLIEKIVNEVEVEALPTELPEKIEVNIENLAQVDEQILAQDLNMPEKVTLMSDPNQIIVKVGELISKEALAQAEEEAAAAAEAATEEATTEGEIKEDTDNTEEETPKEENKPQE